MSAWIKVSVSQIITLGWRVQTEFRPIHTRDELAFVPNWPNALPLYSNLSTQSVSDVDTPFWLGHTNALTLLWCGTLQFTSDANSHKFTASFLSPHHQDSKTLDRETYIVYTSTVTLRQQVLSTGFLSSSVFPDLEWCQILIKNSIWDSAKALQVTEETWRHTKVWLPLGLWACGDSQFLIVPDIIPQPLADLSETLLSLLKSKDM